MAKKVSNIQIENAKLIFKNFAGAESNYNRKGDRNFCVLLEDDKLVEELIKDGWNVKKLSARDETGIEEHYLPVSVRFDPIPPTIYQITKKHKIRLREENVDNLDFADIQTVDLVITPYHWETATGSGIKAYLKTMYVVLNEDRFAQKYEDFGRYDDEDDDLPFN